jgi:hypothetical protein
LAEITAAISKRSMPEAKFAPQVHSVPIAPLSSSRGMDSRSKSSGDLLSAPPLQSHSSPIITFFSRGMNSVTTPTTPKETEHAKLIHSYYNIVGFMSSPFSLFSFRLLITTIFFH